MSEKTYKKNKEVMPNRAKDYYKKSNEILK